MKRDSIEERMRTYGDLMMNGPEGPVHGGGGGDSASDDYDDGVAAAMRAVFAAWRQMHDVVVVDLSPSEHAATAEERLGLLSCRVAGRGERVDAALVHSTDYDPMRERLMAGRSITLGMDSFRLHTPAGALDVRRDDTMPAGWAVMGWRRRSPVPCTRCGRLEDDPVHRRRYRDVG